MKTEPVAAGDTASAPAIKFSTNIIVQTGGFEGSRLYPAGTPSPYQNIAEVPASLREFIVTGDEPDEPSGPPTLGFQPGIIYNIDERGGILSRAGRREAAKLAAGHAFQDWAEEQASDPLREDVRAAAQDSHDRAIGLAKAQLQCNQDAIDRVYAAAAQSAQPREFFVRRGAVFKRCNATRLRPAEQYFVKSAGGWEYAGVINAYAEQPDQEITL